MFTLLTFVLSCLATMFILFTLLVYLVYVVSVCCIGFNFPVILIVFQLLIVKKNAAVHVLRYFD